MAAIQPFVREAGSSGPAVVCIHCNASSSSQWRGLMEQLAPRHRVLAPDLYGSGKTPPWPPDRTMTLQDDVDLIAGVLDAAGDGCVLVGHSYGAAVAMRAALQRPRQVRALALYEPTLFSVIEQQGGPPNDADGIRATGVRARAALGQGRTDEAAREFINYWMGPGSFERMPPERQAPIAASMSGLWHWWPALSTDPTPLAGWAGLRMPVLYMVGERSPRAAHGVAERLVSVLPDVRVHRFEKLGHMGPVTHPDAVNAVIAGFLD
jgi:pimeloyl-ACP methyl ester carboxylesterase